MNADEWIKQKPYRAGPAKELVLLRLASSGGKSLVGYTIEGESYGKGTPP